MIFDHENYLSFLKTNIKKQMSVRGYKTRLAEAMGCQKSYLSQVLLGKAHLTPDHAAKLCRFLKLTKLEQDFFLLLVDRDRAASRELKSILNEKLESILQKRSNLARRFHSPAMNEFTHQALYYRSWIYAAIHMAVGIPSLRTSLAISKHFEISIAKAETILLNLANLGLVKKMNEHWIRTQSVTHLPSNSFLIQNHHTNWRLKSLEQVADQSKHDIFYSSVATISRRDFEKLKSIVLSFLDETRNLIQHSEDEELICLNLDFFKLYDQNLQFHRMVPVKIQSYEHRMIGVTIQNASL